MLPRKSVDTYDEMLHLAQPPCEVPLEDQALLALWGAVMAQGISDAYTRYCSSPSSRLGWLTSSYTGPCSFSWICDLFSIDPAVARAHLLQRFAEERNTQ